MEACSKIGVLGAGRGPGCLVQSLAEPAISLARLAALALACAFIVARAYARPRSQVTTLPWGNCSGLVPISGTHLEKGHPPGRKLKLTRVFTSASRTPL